MAKKILAVLSLLLIASSAKGLENSNFEDFFILSNFDSKEIELRIWIKKEFQNEFSSSSVEIQVLSPEGNLAKQEIINFDPPKSDEFSTIKITLDSIQPWHPKTPNLYILNASFKNKKGEVIETLTKKFGIRKYESKNGKFYINENPFYVRACGHEKGDIVDTFDREAIEKRLKEVKRYGFNALRHHSHCPSDEYLEVADEVGLLVQMEIGGKIGSDPKSERFRESREDWKNMIKKGRQHPCSFIYSLGNEIYNNDPGLIVCQDLLYDLAKSLDPVVLVLNRSGSNPFNDAYGKYDLIERPIGEYEHVAEFANDAFELYLRGDRKGKSDEVPIIAHEYPLVSSYPNPELAHKYKEVPAWLQITMDNLKEKGQEHLMIDYVKNSEKIQNLCRKEMLEEARKFPELDGYSMLRFTDNMDKISGVVDDFADEKNIRAEEFLRTNGETVLLCSWNSRTFNYGDQLEAKIEISHHGEEPFKAEKCKWWLLDGYTVIAEGEFSGVSVNPVDVAEIGKISVAIPTLYKPAKLTLRAALPDAVSYINNEWYFWAFPSEPKKLKNKDRVVLWDPMERMKVFKEAYPGIHYTGKENWKISRWSKPKLVIADHWNDSFYSYLEEKGNIWIISDNKWPWPEEVGIFGLHITKFIPSEQAPILFPELDEHCSKWLTICSSAKSRHGNSGTLIYNHPAIGDFPHEGFCDLQFWPMIYRAKSLQLDLFPKGTEPIIRTIDNYYRGQNKGYMTELGVERGRVFVSTLNLTQSYSWSASTRYMFDQLLEYLMSESWNPSVQMTNEELKKMFQDFAVLLETREPLNHDEMPARYTTRWEKLMSPNEIVVLHVYDAKGIDEDRLAVHWEYAQTQWYYNAQPSDQLTFEFNNSTEGDFACVLNLASTLKNISLNLQVDEREPQKVTFENPQGWSVFQPVEMLVKGLKPGDHKLILSTPEGSPIEDGKSIQIRDLEMRAQAKAGEIQDSHKEKYW